MHEPTPSPDHEGHYLTYLDMINNKDKTTFAKPNEHLPSKSIGKCEICPAWQFSSVTEANRHIKLIHPVYKKNTLPTKTYQCKYNKCDLVFDTYHKLSKHRKEENHFIRKRGNETSAELTNAKKRKTTHEKISTFFAQNRAEVPATVDIVDDNTEEAAHEEATEELAKVPATVDIVDDNPEEAAQEEATEELVQDTAGGDEEMIDEYLETDNISVSINEYVSAVYDKQPYIGRVLDVDGDEVYVDFMEPHVKEKTQQTFQWPSRSDDVWV